jgi:DNA-binding NtrC family response regulator
MEFSPQVLHRLATSPWPGNIRQLRNEVMRLAAISRQNPIVEEDLWESVPTPRREQPAPKPSRPQSLKAAVGQLEKQMILEALQGTRNNQQQAAKALGLSRQGLINKMKRYAIST